MDIDLSNKRMTVFVSVIESVSFDFSENNIYHEDHDDTFGNFLQVSLFFANHIESHANHMKYLIIRRLISLSLIICAIVHERFVRLRMRKPGEYSGIEGITFIHDFRDESIRYVRQSVRFYLCARAQSRHAYAYSGARRCKGCCSYRFVVCRIDYCRPLTP